MLYYTVVVAAVVQAHIDWVLCIAGTLMTECAHDVSAQLPLSLSQVVTPTYPVLRSHVEVPPTPPSCHGCHGVVR